MNDRYKMVLNSENTTFEFECATDYASWDHLCTISKDNKEDDSR
jgi:hypothetical protein